MRTFATEAHRQAFIRSELRAMRNETMSHFPDAPHPVHDNEDALLASCWNVYGADFRTPPLPY